MEKVRRHKCRNGDGHGTVQEGIYRFPACPFFIDLVNALKCLVLQALRAFLI
jgi:hypothetical protein